MAQLDDQRISLSGLVVIIPAVASTLALTYDIGFFYAVGLPYASVFSLGEHIGFALVALPTAIVFAVTLMPGLIGFEIGYRVADKVYTRAAKALADTKDPITAQSIIEGHKDRILWVAIVIGALTLLGTAALVYLGYVVPAVLSFCIGSLPLLDVILPGLIHKRHFAFLVVVLASLGMSFYFGTDSARHSLNSKRPHFLLQLSNGSLRGELLRSGDRGVLFYDAVAKSVGLWRWGEVKRVESLE
jgi:hypothetical protein